MKSALKAAGWTLVVIVLLVGWATAGAWLLSL